MKSEFVVKRQAVNTISLKAGLTVMSLPYSCLSPLTEYLVGMDPFYYTQGIAEGNCNREITILLHWRGPVIGLSSNFHFRETPGDCVYRREEWGEVVDESSANVRNVAWLARSTLKQPLVGRRRQGGEERGRGERICTLLSVTISF